MRICELKQKEVINICTCRTLGCPVDVEFNCETGCITALVVPGPGSFCFCFWGAGSEYIIPWNCIRQIGDDIILVEIDEKYCCKRLNSIFPIVKAIIFIFSRKRIFILPRENHCYCSLRSQQHASRCTKGGFK